MASTDTTTTAVAYLESQGIPVRPASDFESRSLWRWVVRLPGCEQRLTDAGLLTFAANLRDLSQ